MSTTYPPYQAQDLAQRIEADPVVAAQIKDHIKPARLVELLGIGPEVLDEMDAAIVLEYITDRFTKREVLKAFDE